MEILYHKYNFFLSLLCVYLCIIIHYVMLRMLVNLTIPNALVWSLGYIGVPLGPHTQRYAQSTVVTAAVFNELNETVAHLYSTVRGVETRIPRCEDHTVSL